MLCQNCGKYEATTHVKKIINGESAEAHLCSDCAKALGYNDVFGGFGNTFTEPPSPCRSFCISFSPLRKDTTYPPCLL